MTKALTELLDEELTKAWGRLIVERSKEIDPNSELHWESIWIGFVIGVGRAELANYSDYMRLGFPEETKNA